MTGARMTRWYTTNWDLTLLGDGVVANVLLAKTKGNMTTGVGNSNGWIVITWGWAMAVTMGIIVAGPLSGAHINPAFTFGLAVEHSLNSSAGIGWDMVPGYWLGEMVGAIIGAVLVLLFYWDHFKETEDKVLKLAVFCTVPNIKNYGLNLISEIIGTFVLMFVILALGQPHSPFTAGGGLAVGLLVLAIGLSLGGTTGYAINPARDLGPRLVHAFLPVPNKGDSQWDYAWIPVVGPLIGAALGSIVYYVFFTQYIVKAIPS